MIIQEIYESIHGELPLIGKPCTIVRLAGCNLECPYCDAPNKEGFEMALDQIIDAILDLDNQEVLITGGEPLLQFEELCILIQSLVRAFHITIETNGTQPIHPEWDVSWVVDYKLFPGAHFLPGNLTTLGANDALKFVYGNKAELESALTFLRQELRKGASYQVVFSPLNPVDNFHEDILAFARSFSHVDIRLQCQIHKILQLG